MDLLQTSNHPPANVADRTESGTYDLPEVSSADIARYVREGHRLRSQELARLLRVAALGIFRLGQRALHSTPRHSSTSPSQCDDGVLGHRPVAEHAL